ncbi:MAG: hypothetical protein JNM72_11345 [Deltaproteobacteria bacterium]|nr:hypothetical protein [Deltaproteobacteria bacterium]
MLRARALTVPLFFARPARALLAAALLAGPGLLPACGDKDDDGGSETGAGGDGTACTEIAVVSVNLTVLAADGAALSDPPAGFFARFSVDGAAPEPCALITEPAAYGCGVERAGSLFVEIGVDETAYDSDTIEILSDECHVFGQVMTLRLTPPAR